MILGGREAAKIVRVGARAPIGLSALQVAMGMRAGELDPRPTSFKDKRGRTMGTCRVGGLPMGLVGHDRMLSLAIPALREAWPTTLAGKLPVVLALPEAGRADDEPRFGPAFVDALGAKSHCPIDLARSEVVRAGHAGFAAALEIATTMLGQMGANAPPAVVVGGVDSYHHEEVLRALDESHRLHAFGTENGMIPSEGAAFIVLRRKGRESKDAQSQEDKPLAFLTGTRVGREESVLTGAPNIAETLTRIVQELAPAGKGFSWVLTDLNGERHRSREWTLTALRGTLADGAVELRGPQMLGDVGAATGALLAASASMLFTTGAASSTRALVVLQSEGAERGAFVLEEAT